MAIKSIIRSTGPTQPVPVSEALKQPTSSRKPNLGTSNLSEEEEALERIKNREIPVLDLGKGSGTPFTRAAGSYLGGTPRGKVVKAGDYVTGSQAGSSINELRQALGLKGPQGTADTARTAAFDRLDRAAYQGSIQDKTNLAAQGQATGARSQALSALRGSELAGQKAQVEAGIAERDADRMAQYEQALLGAGLGAAQNQSAYNLARSGQLTDANLANARLQAQREQDRARTALSQGTDLNAEEYRRKLAEQQNKLLQISQLNTADMLEIEEDARKDELLANTIGALLSTAGRVGGAAIGAGG
ncbi:hypothetical protein [uncultured Paraglaciecola sp.]|uniref:hypothetical protein n=1 Tax=uncultured Paraglaciecola sp. TaxID=1765024 RepID=UPI0026291975|nr:hypothetical protein [uncultured Paraglaciecola sp.]